MKKVCAIALTLVLLVAVLSGCTHTNLGVKINKDGTGSLAATLCIEQDFYNQLCEAGSDPFEGFTTGTMTREGKNYVTMTETKSYSSYDELEKALLELSYNTDVYEDMEDETGETEITSAAIFKDVKIEKNAGLFYTTYTFSATQNPVTQEAEGYNLNDLFGVTLTVEMPSKIGQIQGGVADGNTVTFEISDVSSEMQYVAVAEQNSYGIIIGIVAVLVVGMAVALIFLKKKG